MAVSVRSDSDLPIETTKTHARFQLPVSDVRLWMLRLRGSPTDLWSSVEMQTSTMSEPKARLGGNMSCERPLRELTGVPDEREEAEEVDSEPCEEDF